MARKFYICTFCGRIWVETDWEEEEKEVKKFMAEKLKIREGDREYQSVLEFFKKAFEWGREFGKLQEKVKGYNSCPLCGHPLVEIPESEMEKFL